ncbi:pilus assembly protein CpaB [Nocardioides ginsengisegetis]|uniref:Pilus assembly protein CpaB n=1 Tax=Nocardioides ginsengisegetis TaxID=661491 RepID=A0A7W3P9W9_9ACTN|nr:Flp pilus assembly protein CpaB [Nocardioides ginsengisegetis]MBA8803968.1 pilus assembly protein CpaB [Nocardioides ginsengisegetis]
MDRRRILLVAAAVVATLGTLLVFLYVRGADARAAEQYDTVDVLRAVAVISPGETIEAASAGGKLALQPVPKDQLLGGYQTSTESLTGLVALTAIYPGEQIIASKFGGQAEAASPLQIPKGEMAISVNLTDPARVAGFVNPGSQVSVFLNGSDATSGQAFTRMLLPRVTVLGVGSTTPVSTTTTDQTGAQTTEQLPRTLLTLALDQQDAQKVLFASGNGELAFALLTTDSAVKPGPGVTALNLFR